MRQVLQDIKECRAKLLEVEQALGASEAGRTAMQEESRKREETFKQAKSFLLQCNAVISTHALHGAEETHVRGQLFRVVLLLLQVGRVFVIVATLNLMLCNVEEVCFLSLM